jgi:sarcosine oxidase subunit gamma
LTVIERRSALAHHPVILAESIGSSDGADPDRLVLSERHGLTVFQVTAFSSVVPEATTSLANALGLSAPACNRFSGSATKSLRYIGPGVWLLVGEATALPPITELRAQLGADATVVDLSHARCVLRLQGIAANRTLAKYCGLDLDVSTFPTGSATNTRFGKIGMHLARTDDLPTFELLVFRGYAEFVFEALCEGAAEFGFRVEP